MEGGRGGGSAIDKIIRKRKCRITLIAVRWSTINYCYTWYAQTSIDMAFRYRCNTHVLRNYVHLTIMRLVHGFYIFFSLFDFIRRRFRSAVTSHPCDVKWKVRYFELRNFYVAYGFGSCTRFCICFLYYGTYWISTLFHPTCSTTVRCYF